MVLTDTHAGNWNAASSGTLATRRYQLQNVGGGRADVVATTIDNGNPYEYIRYSPYGIPTSYPAADANRNGVTNGTDTTDMIAVLGGGSAAVVCHIDLNKDGLYPDTADIDYCNDESVLTGKRGGFNKLGTATGSVAPQRFGYAGYAWDPAIKAYHVRHRVYDPEAGRWLIRDPMSHVDGASLYQYVRSKALIATDPSGLIAIECGYGYYYDPILNQCVRFSWKPPADIIPNCPPGSIWDPYREECISLPGWRNPGDRDHDLFTTCYAHAGAWLAHHNVRPDDPCYWRVFQAYMAGCTGDDGNGGFGMHSHAIGADMAADALFACRGSDVDLTECFFECFKKSYADSCSGICGPTSPLEALLQILLCLASPLSCGTQFIGCSCCVLRTLDGCHLGCETPMWKLQRWSYILNPLTGPCMWL